MPLPLPLPLPLLPGVPLPPGGLLEPAAADVVTDYSSVSFLHTYNLRFPKTARQGHENSPAAPPSPCS